VGKIKMIAGVPATQFYAERDAARARSRPLADARRARTAKPKPRPEPERDVEIHQRSREAVAGAIVWFEPRPLLPGSSVRVVGVAADAAPAVLAEYGVAQ
jgi:hypothetical protein